MISGVCLLLLQVPAAGSWCASGVNCKRSFLWEPRNFVGVGVGSGQIRSAADAALVDWAAGCLHHLVLVRHGLVGVSRGAFSACRRDVERLGPNRKDLRQRNHRRIQPREGACWPFERTCDSIARSWAWTTPCWHRQRLLLTKSWS
jgi:hypothetical protein